MGFASGVHYVHPDKPAELWINEVGVAPSHQRRGLGKRLLQAIFARGRESAAGRPGCSPATSNGPAVRLYRAAGGSGPGRPASDVHLPAGRSRRSQSRALQLDRSGLLAAGTAVALSACRAGNSDGGGARLAAGDSGSPASSNVAPSSWASTSTPPVTCSSRSRTAAASSCSGAWTTAWRGPNSPAHAADRPAIRRRFRTSGIVHDARSRQPDHGRSPRRHQLYRGIAPREAGAGTEQRHRGRAGHPRFPRLPAAGSPRLGAPRFLRRAAGFLPGASNGEGLLDHVLSFREQPAALSDTGGSPCRRSRPAADGSWRAAPRAQEPTKRA